MGVVRGEYAEDGEPLLVIAEAEGRGRGGRVERVDGEDLEEFAVWETFV